MSKINIAGHNDILDVHYRYKMSRLDVTLEKNKTVIQNLGKVASDIGRDESMIIQFFKKQFGTSFGAKDGKHIVAKKLTGKELQDALRDFIEYGVLCPKCRLPETHLSP